MADYNGNNVEFWTRLTGAFTSADATNEFTQPDQPDQISLENLPKFCSQLEQLIQSVTNVLNDHYANGYPVNLRQDLRNSIKTFLSLKNEISFLSDTVHRLQTQIDHFKLANVDLKQQTRQLKDEARQKILILREERALHHSDDQASIRPTNIPIPQHSFASTLRLRSIDRTADDISSLPTTSTSSKSRRGFTRYWPKLLSRRNRLKTEQNQRGNPGVFLDLSPIPEISESERNGENDVLSSSTRSNSDDNEYDEIANFDVFKETTV